MSKTPENLAKFRELMADRPDLWTVFDYYGDTYDPTYDPMPTTYKGGIFYDFYAFWCQWKGYANTYQDWTDADSNWYRPPWIPAALDPAFIIPNEVLERVGSQVHDNIYYSRSGEKSASNLVLTYCTSIMVDQPPMTWYMRRSLAQNIFTAYRERWYNAMDMYLQRWDALFGEYVREILTNDETVTQYGKANTRTDDLWQVVEPNLTRTDYSRGYNTTTDRQTDKNTSTGTRTQHDAGTVGDAQSGSDTATRNYTKTLEGRHGSAARLLQEATDYLINNPYMEIVYNDLDHLLTIPIYK